MDDHMLYQGRMAQLCNLISKPELNGLWVTVFKYEADTNRYAVLRLICPTAVPKMDVVFLSVKLQNLNFESRRTFDLCFPGAVVRAGSAFESNVDMAETVWDLTDSPPREVTDTPLVIRSSCCVRGASQGLCNTQPTSRISCGVVVDCGSPEAFVEFQDIHFVMQFGTLIKCCTAKQVSFRRCVFHGQFAVCIVGTRDVPVDVLFEWCTFEDTARCAVNVGRKAQLTLLNCSFNKLKRAVTMESGASASLIHCHIDNVFVAIVVPKCKSLKLINCAFRRAKLGICIDQCDSLVMKGCSMCDIDSLVLSDVRTANIHECIFQGSTCGVFVTCGDNITHTISNCHFAASKLHDILVEVLATGSLTVQNSTFTAQLGADVVRQYEGCQCRVTVNGTEVRSYIVHQSMLPELDIVPCTGQAQLGALNTVRFHKKVGVGKVLCFGCDKEEPHGVKFKNCAKCNAACYCSRECQVAHWMEHKADCKAVASAGFPLDR